MTGGELARGTLALPDSGPSIALTGKVAIASTITDAQVIALTGTLPVHSPSVKAGVSAPKRSNAASASFAKPTAGDRPRRAASSCGSSR